LVDLVTEGDKVTGAIVKHEDKSIEIHVRQGVVLACGGFPHDILRRKQLFPHAPTGKEHFTPSPTANTGDGLKVAEKVGGWVDTTIPNAAAWCPTSVVPRKDGTFGVVPPNKGSFSTTNTCKPWCAAVTAVDIPDAPVPTTNTSTSITSWLICITPHAN